VAYQQIVTIRLQMGLYHKVEGTYEELVGYQITVGN